MVDCVEENNQEMVEASGQNTKQAGAATDEEIVFDAESMAVEQLVAAGNQVKRQLKRANTKAEKTVQRYVEKLKELQQSKELIKENEKSIETLEEELEEARVSLNAIFANMVEGELFTEDTKISSEICGELLTEMRNNEKKKLEQVKQQAFQHA